MEINKYEVPVEKLRCECDPKLFDFECTKELAPLCEFIGQEACQQMDWQIQAFFHLLNLGSLYSEIK